MSDGELCYLSLAEQSRLIQSREISPRELLDSTLAQIDRLDGKLNAFIMVMRESALDEARQAEEEIAGDNSRGPLHGIPIALKDLLYTKGLVTTAGSRVLRDFVPAEDATVVTRLKEAGAVLVGKTNLNEFAYGATGSNYTFGDVLNPWDPDRMTGGSSSGSGAAVAACMASGALGSDTGGSIRIPASLCGVVGIKPTYGRVSRFGAVPCAWSLDNVGPLCRTAEDAALVLGAIAGWDPKDPATSRQPVPDYAAGLSQDVSGTRVAVLQEYASDPMEPEVVSRFWESLEVLRGLGMKVDEVSVPEVKYAFGASTAILSSEVTAYHEETLRTRPEEYGPDVRARLEQGLLISATDYLKGQRIRAMLIERFGQLFQQYDAVVCPTTATTAPRYDATSVQFEGLTEAPGPALVRHTRLFNLNSLPTVSVPCGFTAGGMPVGLQIASAPFTEGMALRLAHAYQCATEWHKWVPSIAARG